MKLFSNFDTELIDQTYSDYVKNHGEKKILLVTKGKRYLFIKVLLPIFFTTIACGIVFLYLYWWRATLPFPSVLVVGVLCLYYLFLFPSFNALIAYKMDCMILTPDHVMRIDQKGLFYRDSVVITNNTIRSIRIEKDGLLRSIADFGTIYIHAGEGSEDDTMIRMRYVSHPERVREFLGKKG